MTHRDMFSGMKHSARAFALVTGSTAGLGAAVAELLLARGWQVMGVGRRDATIDNDAYTHVSFDLAATDKLGATLGSRLAPLLHAADWGRVALINNAAVTGHLGWTNQLDPAEHARVYAVNVVAPTWLMGFFIETVPRDVALRIVNVSSGAAIRALPGLGAYSMSKAALRMSGMMAGAELDAARGTERERRDTAIVTYMPGIVETDMQRAARGRPRDEFPSQPMFQNFLDSGVVVTPDVPAEEIVGFAETDRLPVYTERQLGGK